jgi:hypothetical protein
MAVSLVSTGVTFPDNSTQTTAATGFGFKNRIINGAMVIDQRNAGASVTVNSVASNYTVDRWFGYGQVADGVFTVQRSTTAPTGFTNSALFTVTTADSSIGASQVYAFGQKIEGFNVADFGWGTASAQTVTLSFQVRSSVTGTYSVTLFNGAFNRGYTATFSVSAANTFETKTITILGDTSGTWLTDNGVGLTLWFSLGTGSTYTGTAGAWNAGTTYGATGQVNLIGTNGATFYITGVQLEKGSTATSFDYRPYSTELQLAQRYYEQWRSRVAGSQNIFILYGTGGNNAVSTTLSWAVTKRVDPTVVLSNNTNTNITSMSLVPSTNNMTFQPAVTNAGVAQMNIAADSVWLTASSEL